MAQYYATISGLPNIGVDDRKLPFSSIYFVGELAEVLTKKDKWLLDLLRYDKELPSIVHHLEGLGEAELKEIRSQEPEDEEVSVEKSVNDTLLSGEKIKKVLGALLRKDKIGDSNIPTFLVDFLKENFVESTEEEILKKIALEEDLADDEKRTSYPLHLEDRLAESYYTFLMHCGNKFVEDWGRFNLNIKNVLAAFIAKSLNWDTSLYVVGDNEIERKLKSSNASNFGLTEDDLPYFSQLQQILNEKDITKREKLLDVLRWNWLEDCVFDHPFDIEAILCYFLQLRILERWTELNEKTGEETFRNIVAALKKESNDSLNEFRKSQKK